MSCIVFSCIYRSLPLLISRGVLCRTKTNVLSNHWMVCLSVCPVHCGKTADQIWMRFGMVSRMGPGMAGVVEFGDRFTGRGFEGECGTPHCNHFWVDGMGWRTLTCKRRCLFPNYFWISCCYHILHSYYIATATMTRFNFDGCYRPHSPSPFLPRDALLSAVYAVVVCLCVCLSVCLSVCPSHSGIVSKWLNVGSSKQRRTIAP